jgi:hypothetical protein
MGRNLSFKSTFTQSRLFLINGDNGNAAPWRVALRISRGDVP